MICDDIWVGTLQSMSDVIQDGAVRAGYLAASEQFLQSESHTFYIGGHTGLSQMPTVYSTTEGEDSSQ